MSSDLARFTGRLNVLLNNLGQRWLMTPDFDRQQVLKDLEGDLTDLALDMRDAVLACDIPDCTEHPSTTEPRR